MTTRYPSQNVVPDHFRQNLVGYVAISPPSGDSEDVVELFQSSRLDRPGDEEPDKNDGNRIEPSKQAGQPGGS